MTIPKKAVKKASLKKRVSKKPALAKPLKKATVVKKISSKPAAPEITGPVKVRMYKNKSYAEEYQVTGFHYAFVSKDNRMCHWWVKCRDFLQDALRNQLTGRNDQIYSFAYRPKEDPEVPTDVTKMMVKRVPTPANATLKKEFDEMMAAGLKLLNFYEKKYGFKPLSKIVPVDHESYPVLFEGPGVWSQGSVMISMYTFFIRLGYWKPDFKDEKSLAAAYDKIINASKQTNDTRYLRTTHRNFDKALINMDAHLFKPKDWKKGDKVLFHDSNMSSFHHHSGIVSLSQFNTPVPELNNKFRKIFA